MQQYLENFLGKLEAVQEQGENQWIARCPAHEDSSPSLSVAIGGDGKILHRCFAGCSNDDVRKALGLTWLDYWPGIGDKPAVPSTLQTQADQVHTDHHEVYDAFLRAIGLTPVHKMALQERGLSDPAITGNQYRTINYLLSARGVRKLEEEFSRERILSTPGFRLSKGRAGQIETVISGPGTLIPVRDYDGRIQGLKVRHDGGPNKYSWFSGGGSPAVTHTEHWTMSGTAENTLFVTEGPLKADIIAALTFDRTLGIGGVSYVSRLPGIIQKDKTATHITFVFDSDVWGTPAEEPIRQAARIIEAQGRTVRIRRWEKKYKGFDDYLTATCVRGHWDEDTNGRPIRQRPEPVPDPDPSPDVGPPLAEVSVFSRQDLTWINDLEVVS